MQTAKRPNYLFVFIALAGFTLIETLVSYVQQAAIKLPTLIVLSVVKAVLVLLYFMHLKFDSKLFSYLFIAGCVLVIPLILAMVLIMPVITP
jgi:cytochrome c oxidase subunit IV